MMMLLAFMHQELLSVYFASTSPKELIYNIMCTVGGKTRRPPTERAWQASLTLRLGHMKSLTLYVRFIYGVAHWRNGSSSIFSSSSSLSSFSSPIPRPHLRFYFTSLQRFLREGITSYNACIFNDTLQLNCLTLLFRSDQDGLQSNQGTEWDQMGNTNYTLCRSQIPFWVATRIYITLLLANKSMRW